MIPIRLERREPARNIQRFYAITVTRTLFGSWAIVREWGRIGQPGTVREMGFEMEGEAWCGLKECSCELHFILFYCRIM